MSRLSGFYCIYSPAKQKKAMDIHQQGPSPFSAAFQRPSVHVLSFSRVIVGGALFSVFPLYSQERPKSVAFRWPWKIELKIEPWINSIFMLRKKSEMIFFLIWCCQQLFECLTFSWNKISVCFCEKAVDEGEVMAESVWILRTFSVKSLHFWKTFCL